MLPCESTGMQRQPRLSAVGRQLSTVPLLWKVGPKTPPALFGDPSKLIGANDGTLKSMMPAAITITVAAATITLLMVALSISLRGRQNLFGVTLHPRVLIDLGGFWERHLPGAFVCDYQPLSCVILSRAVITLLKFPPSSPVSGCVRRAASFHTELKVA
jgi:hypothetical protein